MIDTAPTGFFLFVGLMIAAGFWLFSLPEPVAPAAPGADPNATSASSPAPASAEKPPEPPTTAA